MIFNIVDNRKRKYRWKDINAVIEATAHDNSCRDSDQIDQDEHYGLCQDKKHLTWHEAIVWAEQHPAQVTLFLYDKGDGIEGGE
ncbi:hypothetical protein [Maricaulis sp.]|uniref:hypothetical protein n=1 Tax=Maricaulis sp. TaxID=1486257 RepID=UPI00261AABAF|nr:hypothetical protein [Maricaulis sp.]